MKKIVNRLFVAFAITVMVSACNSFDLDLQDNPLAVTPENASVNDLLNSVQFAMADFYDGTQFNAGALARMYHSGGFTYNAVTTTGTYNFAWNVLYSDALPDVDNVLLLAEAAGLDIHAGTAKLMEAYMMMVAVDLWGDIPYSESGQGTDIISPASDSGSDVYSAAMSLIDEAIAQLTDTNAAAPAFDNFYGGNAENWIKFGNTLKLRAALNMGDAGMINSLVSGGMIIDEASEDFQINFGNQRTNPNSRHPFYNNHYEVLDGNYLSNYYMWLMNRGRESEITDGARIDDPRRRYYFFRKIEDDEGQDATTYGCHLTALPTDDTGSLLNHWTARDANLTESYCTAGNGYSGRDFGNGSGIPPDGPTRTSYGLYPAGGDFDADDFEDTRTEGVKGGLGQGIFPIMLSSFVDFMRAEAALRLGTTDDPQALLESGIRKSFAKVRGFESLVASKMASEVEIRGGGTSTVAEFYGATTAREDSYVAEIMALYNAATSDAERLNVVITEFYIAAWGNGLEAFNMYRRTGLPSNMQPALEVDPGQFPNLVFKPLDHITRNLNATQNDFVTKVFWAPADVNPY